MLLAIGISSSKGFAKEGEKLETNIVNATAITENFLRFFFKHFPPLFYNIQFIIYTTGHFYKKMSCFL